MGRKWHTGKERQRGFEFVSEDEWDKASRGRGVLFSRYEDLVLPKRATKHAAGYDVFSTIDISLYPKDEILIPLGFKAYMNFNECMLFHPRSGLGFKYLRLANTTGVIDSDYYNNESNEGHCMLKLRNEGSEKIEIVAGKAVAQIIFMPFLLIDGDSFDNGETRKGGLGSTG